MSGALIKTGMAIALALALSSSYLLDGPSETEAAQAVAEEAEYAEAVADGGAAKCSALGRTPVWTPNGDLICRLPKRPVTLAQGEAL